MRSTGSLGRGASLLALSGSLALALSMTGCGAATAAKTLQEDMEDAETLRLLARLRFERTTLTLREIGETYAEREWPAINRSFEPAYDPITEAEAFQWQYLGEVSQKRRALLQD